MPSVLETIASDYRDYGSDEAGEKYGQVVAAIGRAVKGIDTSKRLAGALLNRADESGLAAQAQGEDHDAKGRETAVSALYKKCGIKPEDAAAWRKFARGEDAREAVGMKKALAVSAYRDIDASASQKDIEDMLRTHFIDNELSEGEKRNDKPTRKDIGTAAAAENIGTESAGTSGGTPPVAEGELQDTPAQERTALVNRLLELHADGVLMTRPERKKVTAILVEMEIADGMVAEVPAAA